MTTVPLLSNSFIPKGHSKTTIPFWPFDQYLFDPSFQIENWPGSSTNDQKLPDFRPHPYPPTPTLASLYTNSQNFCSQRHFYRPASAHVICGWALCIVKLTPSTFSDPPLLNDSALFIPQSSCSLIIWKCSTHPIPHTRSVNTFYSTSPINSKFNLADLTQNLSHRWQRRASSVQKRQFVFCVWHRLIRLWVRIRAPQYLHACGPVFELDRDEHQLKHQIFFFPIHCLFYYIH